MLSPENRKNLETLAAYLEKLPEDYRGFSMEFFRRPPMNSKDCVETCGTVACAIGHGPEAGMPKGECEDWFRYSERVFGMTDDGAGERLFDMMFSDEWAVWDDTPKGAASRIRRVLAGEDIEMPWLRYEE